MAVTSPETPTRAPEAPTAISRDADRDVAVGVMLGVLAAICYTGTNIALRGVTREGDFDWALWVTCLKVLPGMLIAWSLIGVRTWSGKKTLPGRRVVALLLTAGLFTQCCGNLLFQISLSMCGLALAVPTVFATLMLAGAILGRFVLGERVTWRSVWATGLLLAAIGLLSLGASAAGKSLPPGPQGVSATLWVLGGIGLAGVAGVFYGILGVVIRRSTHRAVPLPATLALVGTTGVLGLGIPALVRLGPSVLDVTLGEGALMIGAGVMNGIAFFAIAGSLRRIPVVQVNLINASQATLCALGGVFVYGEALSWGLASGTALTIVGLTLLDRRKPVATNSPANVATIKEKSFENKDM